MRKLFIVVIFAALVLPACSGMSSRPTATPVPARPTPNAAELNITDPAKPIDVAVGSEFTITVRANASPDYHWEMAKALDPKIVEYIWKNFVPDDPSNPNSSGKDVWRFKAVGSGTTTVTLGYYQGMTDTTAQMPVYTIVVK